MNNCPHTAVHFGPDVPRLYGSFRSMICDACEHWTRVTHVDEVPRAPWMPLATLEQAADETEERW